MMEYWSLKLNVYNPEAEDDLRLLFQVDPVTYAVNPRDIANAINSNTICIVGSVPQYPHGIMDDIAALSEIAVR